MILAATVNVTRFGAARDRECAIVSRFLRR
jgi:hypothetical protein